MSDDKLSAEDINILKSLAASHKDRARMASWQANIRTNEDWSAADAVISGARNTVDSYRRSYAQVVARMETMLKHVEEQRQYLEQAEARLDRLLTSYDND